MRKIGMVLAVFCFLAGCSSGSEPRIKIGVEAKNSVPVVVVNDANEKLPVELNVSGGKAIPVELMQRSGEAVPVKIQADKVTIGIASAAILAMVLTSIFAYMAARNSKIAAKIAAGSAKAAAKGNSK